MHIVLDEDIRAPTGDETKVYRTKYEKKYKRVNTLVLLIQFTCFLVMITEITTRGEKTFRGDLWYPGKDKFALTVQLKNSLQNCSYTGTLQKGGWELPFTISLNNSDMLIAETAGRIRVAVFVNAFAIAAGSMNKILYDLNVHFITKLGRLKVRKQLLLFAEFILITWAIVAMEALEDSAWFLHSWTTKCDVKFLTIFSVPPFIVMYVGHIIVVLSYGVNFIMLLQSAYRTKEEVEREAIQRAEEMGDVAPVTVNAAPQYYDAANYDNTLAM